MTKMLGLGLAIALVAMPAVASAEQAVAPAQSRLNEIVCKDVQQDSATRYGHRKVCMNRIDWEIRMRHDQASLVHYQDAALMLHR